MDDQTADGQAVRRGARSWVGAITLVALAASTATVLAGCVADPDPAADRVGIVSEVDGEVGVLFAGCAGDVVEAISLKLSDENHERIGPVLWEIESRGPAPARIEPFTIGETPDGFEETVGLERPIGDGDHLFVVVTTRAVGTIGVSFDVDELRSDEVHVAGAETRSRAEFEAVAARGCPEG